MISASILKPIEKPAFYIREENGPITLEVIKRVFEDTNNDNYGLPINITYDQVKSGGFFNSSVEDCLIITNTLHPNDYFKYCITIRKQGKIATVTMTYWGTSSLTAQKNKQEERNQSGSLGGMLLNLVSGVNENDYNAEYQYYDMLEQMFVEVCQ
ncbi:MAG: hypothetical protein IJN22_05925 [Clostridia bacterium]|nr:hypothetical protein [Clostridia bacterium]